MKRYEVTLEGMDQPVIIEADSKSDAEEKAQERYPALPRKVDYKTLKSPEPLSVISIVELSE